MEWQLDLLLSNDRLAICRMPRNEKIPAWAETGNFVSVTRTAEELSVVCAEEAVPEGIERETGWRLLRIEGRLGFALTGVLASLAGPLADAGVSIFAVSTFNTDYLMVKHANLDEAIAELRAAGHRVKQSS